MTNLEKYQPLFCQNTKKLANNLVITLSHKKSVSKSDIIECQRLAHVIKSSAAMMKCENLSQLAEIIELLFARLIKESQLAKDQLVIEKIKSAAQAIAEKAGDYQKLKTTDFKLSKESLEKYIN